ncbi:hypothetical protein ScPMuIL_001067 [Solemya velum]
MNYPVNIVRGNQLGIDYNYVVAAIEHRICNGILFVASFGVYWLVGGLFLCVDTTGRPAWFVRYKTQPEKTLDMASLRRGFSHICLCTAFIAYPFSYFQYFMQKRQGSKMTLELPSLTTVLWQLFVCTIIEEIGFYYSHRALHSSTVYRTIHKIHHEWVAPIGITAIYAHPVEVLFSNLVPLGIGPILLASRLSVSALWFVIGSFMTVIHHSGYHLPLLPSPEFHDFHHLK